MAATDIPRFGFRLVSPDGDAFGTVDSAVRHLQTGDIVTADGVRYRVVSIIPIEVMAELVDGPLHGVLEVEPIYASGGRDSRPLALLSGRRVRPIRTAGS